MERMDELVLKHETHGGIKHLSFVSRPHMSPKETISLPFYEADDEIGGNCCRGMFYFDNFEGKAVVCNLTTKECKLLTHPNEDAFFCNSGLGYDPKSDDYKVIRNHCPSSTAEVYSLKNNSWKVISGPGNDINTGPECGVYLGGKCYWIVWMYTPEYDGVQDFILSFDFTNESFAQLPLPLPLRPEDQDHVRDFKIDLFDCNGLLSVVGFKSVEDYETRVAKHFELWVYENGVWASSFSAILVDVERPFGVKDGRFLFLEGNSSCKHNHLMVYDWIKEELREHRFYDVQPSQMLVFSYVENTTMLPDAKPLINVHKMMMKTRRGMFSEDVVVEIRFPKVSAEVHKMLNLCQRRSSKDAAAVERKQQPAKSRSEEGDKPLDNLFAAELKEVDKPLAGQIFCSLSRSVIYL
ncbi:hypothetical protein OROGR_030268 [Orobanche gracilis]